MRVGTIRSASVLTAQPTTRSTGPPLRSSISMKERNPMAAKQPMQRNNSRGANRKRSPGRKIVARAGARINRSAMKGSKATGEAANRLLSHRANGANGRNGAPSKSVQLTFQQSRIALEQANQRYVDLFD